MKGRTDSTITVGFKKLAKDVEDKLSYFVEVAGDGSENAQGSCDGRLSECTVSRLSPGRAYDITVKSCIAAALEVCSDASDVSTFKTLPQGKTAWNMPAALHKRSNHSSVTHFCC